MLLLLAVVAVDATGRGWGTWADAAGGAVIALGVALLVSSAVALGRAVTPFPAPKPGHGVAAAGPYRYARHPMYGSVILLALGASVLCGSWPGLILTSVLVAFFDLKSRREEAWLAARDGYAAYRARTRRRLLPFVY